MNIYKNPLYYDIAFSWRNIKAEIDFFENCINKFSKVPVKNMLEIACGASPYFLELSKRGYSFSGLDNSKEMLDYSMKIAKQNNVSISLIKANMFNFKVQKKYDFAFCMLGSIFAKSNEEFLKHLNLVSKSLKRGAIYLIEACIKWDTKKMEKQNWVEKKDNVTVSTKYEEVLENKISRLMIENLSLKIEENGKTKFLNDRRIVKMISPQEFLGLVKKTNFEFFGWFENFEFKKVTDVKNFSRIISVLRNV